MKPQKNEAPKAIKAMPSPLGQIVLVRSTFWKNGNSAVAAIVTGVETVTEMELEGADFIVSLTAFPPGAQSRMLQNVPLFAKEPEAGVMPAAWRKR